MRLLTTLSSLFCALSPCYMAMCYSTSKPRWFLHLNLERLWRLDVTTLTLYPC